MLISGDSSVTLRVSSGSSLSIEVSLKDTRLILTGLGGTIKKGIPAKFSLTPGPLLMSASTSLDSAPMLLRLCEGEMFGVGCITLISICRAAVSSPGQVEEEEVESFSWGMIPLTATMRECRTALGK